MSEYWVSKKRYWCKYCETYIADDAPSRSQHENGLRHKGNKERFVRGLYKQAEQKKKDAAEEAREMARVDQAARAAFAADVSSGNAKGSSSSLPPPRASASSTSTSKPKPANAWSNYSTAESLGYTDPDAERAAAEAERRRTQGVAGEWTVVESVPPPPPPHPDDVATAAEEQGTSDGVAVAGGDSRKREAEAPPADEDDTRAFKVRKKTWGNAGALGDLWEGDIPIKLKVRKAEPTASSEEADAPAGSSGSTTVTIALEGAQASERPKWTTRGWNTPGSSTAANTASTEYASNLLLAAEADNASATKVEDTNSDIKDEDLRPVKAEDISSTIAVKTEDAPVKAEDSIVKTESTELLPATDTAGMFRKRKIPAASAGSRVRR